MTAPPSAAITLAYSVDADDAFMFHALRAGRIDTGAYRFDHQRLDTAALNALAVQQGADVIAVSTGVYPAIAAPYLLLPHGASVGRGFGPVVVARRPTTLAQLAGARVGIPGLSTTAWLVLRLMQPKLVPVVVPIAPFGRIFDALDRDEIDAALLIHEGRLLFEHKGYCRVAELGEWWQAHTGLPLPLGVNVIRRALGSETVAAVSEILARSISWALGHREELLAVLAAEGQDRGDAALADRALLDRYLGMYANEDTRKMPADARAAVDALFARAAVAGLLPGRIRAEWAP